MAMGSGRYSLLGSALPLARCAAPRAGCPAPGGGGPSRGGGGGPAGACGRGVPAVPVAGCGAMAIDAPFSWKRVAAALRKHEEGFRQIPACAAAQNR